jgi:hypothetical protein
MALFFMIFSSLVALSLALTGLLYLLRRRFAAAGPTFEHLHPSVFSFFTTIYAFFLGFAIVTLWSTFLTTQANVTREADALLLAYRLSKILPDSGAFRRSLLDYVQSVVEDEWPTMEASDTMSEKTQQSLEKVWDTYLLLRPAAKSDPDLYSEYLEIGNRLSEAGRQRLSRAISTQGNLYPPVWVIIIFGFLAILFGLYFNHLQQNRVRLCFDFMVIFLVLCCIYFIYDIDTPFSGYITVKADIFKHVHAKMLALR